APIAIHPARWLVTTRATMIEAISEIPPVAGTRASVSGEATFAVMPVQRPKRVATGIVTIAAKNAIAAVVHWFVKRSSIVEFVKASFLGKHRTPWHSVRT